MFLTWPPATGLARDCGHAHDGVILVTRVCRSVLNKAITVISEWKDQMFSVYFPLSDVWCWHNIKHLNKCKIFNYRSSHINPSNSQQNVSDVPESVCQCRSPGRGRGRQAPGTPSPAWHRWHVTRVRSQYNSSHLMQDIPHSPSQRQSFRSFWQSRSCNKLFLRASVSIHHHRKGDDDVNSSRWPSISLNSQYLNTLSNAGHPRSRDIKFIPCWTVSFPEWWIIIVTSNNGKSPVLPLNVPWELLAKPQCAVVWQEQRYDKSQYYHALAPAPRRLFNQRNTRLWLWTLLPDIFRISSLVIVIDLKHIFD